MSGQQIGSVVGGVIGAYFGGQIGYAIGSAIGGAIGGYIDPTVIKGPKLTDATQQTASDGVPIPWGDGTFPTAGNIIWTTQLTERAKEDDGKGTGIVNVTYHYYRSFAIGICQGVRQSDGTYLPIEGILQVKKNGKVVYDVTPGIDHSQAAQNAKFMRNTRFYLGSETQLPDSVIESYMGIGDTPAYPGTVYMVRDNVELTETGGAIEQYEFVVSVCGDTENVEDNIYPFNFVASAGRAYLGGSGGQVWDDDAGAGTGSSFVRIVGSRILLFHSGGIRYTDNYFDTTSTFSAPWSTMGVPPVVTSSGRIYVAEPSAESVYYSDDQGETWITVNVGYTCDIIDGDDNALVIGSTADDTYRVSTSGPSEFGAPISFASLQAISYGDGMFIITRVLSSTAYWSENALVTLNPVSLPSPGGDALENRKMFRTSTGAWLAVNRVNTNSTDDLIARSADGKQDFEYVTTPPASMDGGNIDSRFAEFDGSIVCVAQSDTSLFVPLLSTDFGETWTAITHGMSGFTITEADSVAAVVAQGLPIPDAPGFYVTPEGDVIGGAWTELTRCRPSLADIVRASCLRSGLVEDDFDVSELEDDVVDGFKVATETTGEAIISPLMSGWFFDAGEWDDKIRFPKRGHDVVAELTVDDLCESDGDVIEETELQEAELLRKVHIRTIDPAAGFTVTTQTAERRTSTVLAKGEQTTEIPVVTDKDTQARMADKKMKVGWSETRRFKTCIPYTRPDLTVTDVIGLTDKKGKRQRVRLMEMAEDSGRIEIREAMLERQSSYTSNVEGTPHGPPTSTSPGIIGPTFGVPMNLPSLRTSDNVPGVYLAACGYLRGWGGCAVLLSVDGGVSYQQVTQFTEPSTMGILHQGCTASSEPISVFMNSGTLSSITADQIALRMNAFAITTGLVSEIGQFQTAVLGTDDIYDLTGIVRGALGTTAAIHYSGDPFVMAASAQFMPMDISLAGRTLYFKFVSFGTSPDDAVPIPFVFDPIFTSVTVDILTVAGEPVTVSTQPIYVVTQNA